MSTEEPIYEYIPGKGLKFETMKWGSNLPYAKLIKHVLLKGNQWAMWWPYSLKMSGYCSDVTDGRVVEIFAAYRGDK